MKETCPLSALEVLEAGYLESRARLLEVAAMLDRIDRAREPEKARNDFRYRTLRKAIEVLSSDEVGRAKALLIACSDPTLEPLESAAGMKGAVGAWAGGKQP